MMDDAHGVHDYVYDERNADILVSINGELKHRDAATVSVFESGYLLGDGVWEGMRVHNGGVAFLEEHLKRLYAGAKTIDMDIGLSPAQLTQQLFDCLKAQEMHEGVHIRLMVTRGVKKTPYQGPRFTITPPTIVIIPEYKSPVPAIQAKGVSLFTAHVRRTGPAEQDQKLNSHSKLNCILACIQADKAGADEALMLDPDGFVATCNSTHFFIVRDGEVWTSPPEYCLGGITRGNIIRVCRENGIPVFEKRFSLFDVYSADEAFITGTFAGTTPVREADGRSIATLNGPVTQRLSGLYKALVEENLTPIT
ncbi:MAG: aminotransferase class IV [Pseudomonadota bacterium]|nr:aminotransferase class IV [Pseudomonadota bacterium]